MVKPFGLLFVFIVMSLTAYANTDLIIASKWPELILDKEYVVDNMPDGNLSGIADCGDGLWVESDRSDVTIYKLILEADGRRFKAESKFFTIPPVPKNAVPLISKLTNIAIGLLRGGVYDFEGISCDAVGNKYLVSEAYLAVLKIPKEGKASWLKLPDNLWQQARSRGLLQKTNQLLEGIAVSPDGNRLWLAAERNKRGLLAVAYDKNRGWQCPHDVCVLLAEGGQESLPVQSRRKHRVYARDFADLSFYKNKLFTLERGAYRLCRRDLEGKLEQCWSYAEEALQPQRQYYSYGMPEALWVDDKGAWIGIDNDIANKRVDGETKPIVWRFLPPNGGWLATEDCLDGK